MHSSSRSASSSSLKRIEKDDNERFAILYVGICFKIFVVLVVVSATFVVAVFEGAITDVGVEDDDVVVVVSVGATAAATVFVSLRYSEANFDIASQSFKNLSRSINASRAETTIPRMLIQIRMHSSTFSRSLIF